MGMRLRSPIPLLALAEITLILTLYKYLLILKKKFRSHFILPPAGKPFSSIVTSQIRGRVWGRGRHGAGGKQEEYKAMSPISHNARLPSAEEHRGHRGPLELRDLCCTCGHALLSPIPDAQELRVLSNAPCEVSSFSSTSFGVPSNRSQPPPLVQA